MNQQEPVELPVHTYACITRGAATLPEFNIVRKKFFNYLIDKLLRVYVISLLFGGPISTPPLALRH